MRDRPLTPPCRADGPAAAFARPASWPPSPPAQLTDALTAAKLAGVEFDVAWSAALDAVAWPSRRRSAELEREAIIATASEWRAAYEDRPSPIAAVLPLLLDGLASAA